MINEEEGAAAGEDRQGDRPSAETREAAAQAGGYNAPSRPALATEDTPNLTQPDVAADGEGVDDGRIETQEAREGAGPFTGTGNQDAMRTAGRTGASDAHHADQRTSADESATEGDEEGGAEQPTDAEDAEGTDGENDTAGGNAA